MSDIDATISEKKDLVLRSAGLSKTVIHHQKGGNKLMCGACNKIRIFLLQRLHAQCVRTTTRVMYQVVAHREHRPVSGTYADFPINELV